MDNSEVRVINPAGSSVEGWTGVSRKESQRPWCIFFILKEGEKALREATDSVNLCFFHNWYISSEGTPEPNWNPWAATSTEKLWGVLSTKSFLFLSESSKFLQDWKTIRLWRRIQIEHLFDSAIFNSLWCPSRQTEKMIIHCHYRLCDKHSEHTGTLAHWEQANLTQKSDWECPELLKQFKCPTIREYLNVTITVIRNMRELLKYAFKNHLIRWEITIKPDIKIAYTEWSQ